MFLFSFALSPLKNSKCLGGSGHTGVLKMRDYFKRSTWQVFWSGLRFLWIKKPMFINDVVGYQEAFILKDLKIFHFYKVSDQKKKKSIT